MLEALPITGDDCPLLTREGPERPERHPPALEIDEVSMLGEAPLDRRELGPHEGKQRSGIHLAIFNARTTHTVPKRIRARGGSEDAPGPTKGRVGCACVVASLNRFRPEPTRKEVSASLALTDNAVEAVKNIVSVSDNETSGLRMVAERAGTEANFQLSVVPLPAEDDEVIEERGARIFLEPEAASLLDDKVLDASVEQNQVAFTIADQIEE